MVDRLEGLVPTRICRTDLMTGDTRVITFGPNVDRSPKYSPDGRKIAFLSDRGRVGDFQLYLLDASSEAAVATPRVAGWIEYLSWSPDGERVLLGVAEHGADVAGGQGAITSKTLEEDVCTWMPRLDTGEEGRHWRSAWVYEVKCG